MVDMDKVKQDLDYKRILILHDAIDRLIDNSVFNEDEKNTIKIKIEEIISHIAWENGYVPEEEKQKALDEIERISSKEPKLTNED